MIVVAGRTNRVVTLCVHLGNSRHSEVLLGQNGVLSAEFPILRYVRKEVCQRPSAILLICQMQVAKRRTKHDEHNYIFGMRVRITHPDGNSAHDPMFW